MFVNEVNFNIGTIVNGHHGTLYRKVRATKIPFDFILYQMLINEIKPDLIIEIGTAYGGSALYMADLLNLLGKGMIHTIDLVDFIATPKPDEPSYLVYSHPRIKRFLSGWQGYSLDNAKGFEKILVIEDGSHQYDACLGVMNKFSPLICKDSYLIIEDGLINFISPGAEKEYNGGPLRAISEFLEKNTNFVIDRQYCDFFGVNTTGNVNGYLKRVN
jgi:cephalosporin hydroxylase